MLDFMIASKTVLKKIIPLSFRKQLLQASKKGIFGPILRQFCLGKGHIFMLHRVHPPEKKLRLGGLERYHITPEGLETIINKLKEQNYLFLSMDELYRSFHKEHRRKKICVFTFDDGYAGNLTYAYPILKKHQVPFIIYVPTGVPDKTMVMWPYLLEDMILDNNFVEFKDLDGTVKRLNCGSAEEKESVYSRLAHKIQFSDENAFGILIEGIFTRNGIDWVSKSEGLGIKWDQIKELASDPMVTIGSHCIDHFLLSKVSPSRAHFKIMESKKRLEAKLETEVKHFSFPYGSTKAFGVREIEMVQEAGYDTAVASFPGNLFLRHQEYFFSLPRVTFPNENNLSEIDDIVNGISQFRVHGFKEDPRF